MKRTLSFSLLMLCASLAGAQQLHNQEAGTNFGMSSPHDAADLPLSRVALQQPVRAAHFEPETVLHPVEGSSSYRITGGWELAEYGSDEWYNATVPGTVLTTLVDRGVYPDPFYGVNNLAIPEDLCRKEWLYRIRLHLTESQLSHRLELLFNGINYRAQVSFNGTELGTVEGAFIRGRFDITALARGDNEILVHIFPPYHPGIPHEQSARTGRGPNGGVLCLDGPTFISSEGWDWVPGVRDRNIGIWQDVILVETDDVTIGDTRIVTDLPLPSLKYADISVSTSVSNPADTDREVIVNAVIAGKKLRKSVRVPASGSADVTFNTRLRRPKLWWPNGYGEQNLYDCRIEAVCEGRSSDVQTTRFGVRELSYETAAIVRGSVRRFIFSPTDLPSSDIFNNRLLADVGDGVSVPSLREGVAMDRLKFIDGDPMGPYFVIRCNGVRIFCRGGNWGMDDMLKRCSRERLEPFMLLHRQAGFNMIRNWTGESTEETFYELCDEYGMLVWNDFWLSTEGYNLDVEDEALWMRNAADVVRRFRNHPSIAVWCPRNEGYAPESLENALCKLIAEEDGTRHYHPNSRYANLRPSGDWHYYSDASRYFSERAKGFNTEQGSPSVPGAASVRKFMAPEDCWPIGDVWRYHDLHPETEGYVAAVSALYGVPTGLDDFCTKAQMINYDSYRAMFESWNARMWDNTSGMLLWMSHPAWPSVEWQTYSWDRETYGAWFGSRKACEPLHPQMNLDDYSVCVVNVSREDTSGLRLSVTFSDLSGNLLEGGLSASDISAKANSLTRVGKVQLPDYEGVYIVRLVLSTKTSPVSVNDYILKGGDDFTELNSLPKAAVSARRIGEGKVEVSNTGSDVVAVGVTMRLPGAVFSDGQINLLPREKRVLEYVGGSGEEYIIEGYNI